MEPARRGYIGFRVLALGDLGIMNPLGMLSTRVSSCAGRYGIWKGMTAEKCQWCKDTDILPQVEHRLRDEFLVCCSRDILAKRRCNTGLQCDILYSLASSRGTEGETSIGVIGMTGF